MEIINNNLIKTKPTAGDAYGSGWAIMWKAFVGLLVVTIIYSVISGPIAMFQSNGDYSGWSNSFSWVMLPMTLFAIGFGLFIYGPIGYSVKWVYLKAVRGEQFDIKDMFSVFQRNYWNAVAANVVVGLIVGIGIFMLIIPGIIFAIRLTFVPYLVIDREMEISEALTKSWEMTKGYGGQIFLMGFMSVFIFIAGLIVLIFGVVISIMWIHTSFAAFYQAVVEEEGYFNEGIIEAENNPQA